MPDSVSILEHANTSHLVPFAKVSGHAITSPVWAAEIANHGHRLEVMDFRLGRKVESVH